MSDESRRAAGILAQCKWLRDNISKWEAQAKEVLARELEGGERTKAVAADGTVIGSVTRAEGARSMSVDNEVGFLMWVKERYPHEIVETVRPAFIKLCGEKVKVLGHLPDANGELCPHVSLSVGDPRATVQLKDQDRLVIEDMFMHRHMPEIMAQMETLEALELPDSQDVTAGYMCPKCGKTSHHPDDIANRYCGNCHTYQEAAPEVSEPDGSVTVTDPEPFIEEGPPNWRESNTFEDRPWVQGRR